MLRSLSHLSFQLNSIGRTAEISLHMESRWNTFHLTGQAHNTLIIHHYPILDKAACSIGPNTVSQTLQTDCSKTTPSQIHNHNQQDKSTRLHHSLQKSHIILNSNNTTTRFQSTGLNMEIPNSAVVRGPFCPRSSCGSKWQLIITFSMESQCSRSKQEWSSFLAGVNGCGLSQNNLVLQRGELCQRYASKKPRFLIDSMVT